MQDEQGCNGIRLHWNNEKPHQRWRQTLCGVRLRMWVLGMSWLCIGLEIPKSDGSQISHDRGHCSKRLLKVVQEGNNNQQQSTWISTQTWKLKCKDVNFFGAVISFSFLERQTYQFWTSSPGLKTQAVLPMQEKVLWLLASVWWQTNLFQGLFPCCAKMFQIHVFGHLLQGALCFDSFPT